MSKYNPTSLTSLDIQTLRKIFRGFHFLQWNGVQKTAARSVLELVYSRTAYTIVCGGVSADVTTKDESHLLTTDELVILEALADGIDMGAFDVSMVRQAHEGLEITDKVRGFIQIYLDDPDETGPDGLFTPAFIFLD